MKMLKKTLAFFLALAMLLCIAPMPASAAVETGGTLSGGNGPYTAPCVEDGYFVVTPNVGSAWHDYSDGGTDVLLLGGEYDGRIYFTVTGEADVRILACSHDYDTVTELILEEADEGTVASYEFSDVYINDGEYDSSQWEVDWLISDLGPGLYCLRSESSSPVAISQIGASETTDDPHTHSLEEVVTAPQCLYYGYTELYCSGKLLYTYDFVDPLGHEYEDHKCVRCGADQLGHDILPHFDASHLEAAADNEVIPEGSFVCCEDYFYVDGKVTMRTSSSSGAVKYVELAKELNGKISFNVNADGASVIINACSTSKSNSSLIGLMDAEGNLVANEDGATIATVSGTGDNVVTYSNLPAGSYSVVSPEDPDDTISRNTRVYTIDVTDFGFLFTSEVAQAPSCTEGGVLSRTCSCGVVFTEEIPAAGHAYEAAVTAPTCTSQGYTTYTCSACGDSYTADYVNALDHSFENGTCGVCGAADPDYTAPEAPKQGLQKADDGNYYYYVDGEIATGFTGLVENAAGRWYIENGKAMLNYDGMIEFEGTKYLIKGGRVNTSFSGISKQEGVYYYFGTGVNDLEFEGLVLCNGMKAYVQDGEVNFNKTGVVEDNGQLLYVKYGIWRNTFKGLARTDDGQWIYMANGTFDETYTGVAKLNANWVYVENGYVSSTYSGTVTVNGVDYTVKYGVVQF